jgi:hypothetical protein
VSRTCQRIFCSSLLFASKAPPFVKQKFGKHHRHHASLSDLNILAWNRKTLVWYFLFRAAHVYGKRLRTAD